MYALDCVEIHDVYNNTMINKSDYEMDHFVPWSFVMNDELWNLMPMVSVLNSQKSNNLPEWDKFFKGFADNQFKMYELVCERDGIRSLFEKCYKDNLHSIWAQMELYKAGTRRTEFIEILSKNMRPIYDSAKRQGYSVWKI